MIFSNLRNDNWWSRDTFSNQTTGAEEACRSREISVDLIIIIVFLWTYSYFCYILTFFFWHRCANMLTLYTFIYRFCLFVQNRWHLIPIQHPVGSYVGYFFRRLCIYVPSYTRLYTCLTSIPRFSLRDKVTLRLLKLLFLGSGCSRVV
jgi:hypothetical protein